MKRFLVILKTEVLLFMRDFFGVFFTFVFPAVMLLLFGGIYGNDPISPESSIGIMDVSVPAYAVMVIGVTGLMSFPLTLASYKEKKVYKRFDATPIGKKNIILVQTLVNIVMTLIGILILLLFGKLFFQIQIQGNIFSIFIAMLFSIATMFSLGFLFTALGKDEKMTNAFCYLVYFVSIFLSGATMPDMLFPSIMQTISKCLPMTYAVDLMQGVFSGNALGEYITELIILGILTIIFTIIGGILYRKKDWT